MQAVKWPVVSSSLQRLRPKDAQETRAGQGNSELRLGILDAAAQDRMNRENFSSKRIKGEFRHLFVFCRNGKMLASFSPIIPHQKKKKGN